MIIARTTIRFSYFWYICLILCQTIPAAYAQVQLPTQTAAKKPDLEKLIAAVEADPANVKAINMFLHAAKDDAIIEKYYKVWMKRFPKAYAIPFTLGDWYADFEDPKAKDYLLKALAIYPEQPEAWYLLSVDAMRLNDTLAIRNSLEKAISLDYNNPKYAFHYAFAHKSTEPAKYQRLILEAIRRFPDAEQGAQAFYWLANDAKVHNEKLMYYELLYARYIDKRSPWLEEGMNEYYVLLLDTNPGKALELATKMFLGLKQNWGHWPGKIEVARKFRDAHVMLAENKPDKALEILSSVDLGRRVSADYISARKELMFLKASTADKAGNTRAAYDSLAVSYSRIPEEALGKTMVSYGLKLGKDTAQVFKDIWQLRDSYSEKATVFNLKGYLKDEEVSLADFKGKIVLLTYWFPGCGPCRKEFPHFESVIKKINNKDLVYLGVNIIRQQDDYVIPFMEKSGYSFLPLKDEPFKDKGTLPAPGAPTNYLIDEEGNIVFKNFMIDENNQRTLELMISEIQNRKRKQG